MGGDLFTHHYAYRFSEEEIEELKIKTSEHHSRVLPLLEQKRALEDQLKSLKADIKIIDSEHLANLRRIELGYESRQCHTTFTDIDTETNEVVYIDESTGEEIDRRPKKATDRFQATIHGTLSLVNPQKDGTNG